MLDKHLFYMTFDYDDKKIINRLHNSNVLVSTS